jgi:carboxyl-terminal processing protease
MKHLSRIAVSAFFSIAFICCNKKDVITDPLPTDSLGIINRWVLDSMRRYYYWGDKMPSRPDYTLPTDQFFTSLLSDQDRYSWIANGRDVIAPSNTYFTYGFQYALVKATGYQGYIGVVSLVNTSGGADAAGLQRGSYFTQVNGVDITDANMAVIVKQLKTGSQVTLTPAVFANNTWTALPAITIKKRYSAENSVRLVRTFSAGGIVTGYLFYNSFDEYYDASLLQAFGKLKQANINELIIDLRYNAGGSVPSCAKLCAMITKNITADGTFVIYKGNSHEGTKPRTTQAVLNTSGNITGRQFNDLLSYQLPLQRVFILTTGATLSASELLVNNLKPFVEVIQVGETTAGKDEASLLVTDQRTPPKVEWKMQPIMYKLFNRNNQGGYDKGIVPQQAVSDMAQIPLYPFGSVQDPLVNSALQKIYNNNLPDTFRNLRSSTAALPVIPVYRSAERQPVSQWELKN